MTHHIFQDNNAWDENRVKGFESIPGDVTIADADGIVLYANPFALKLSGFEKKDLLGRPMTDFWDQSPETSWEILDRVKENGSWQGEIRHRHKNGNSFWEQVSLCLWAADSGAPPVMVKNGLALAPPKQSALHKMENECRKLNRKIDRYVTVLDASPDPVCLSRLEDGRFIYVNKAFYDRTGFTPEDIAVKTTIDLNMYEEAGQREQLIRRLKRKGRLENVEMRVRVRDGSFKNEYWSLQIIEYGGTPHLMVVSRSNDELRAAQQALRESEAGYRAILESAPYSIVVTRRSDARYVEVNEAFCRRTGFNREETIGSTAYDLGVAPDRHLRQIVREKLAKDGRVESMETQFRSKDGRVLDNLMSVAPLTYRGEDCLVIMTIGVEELKAAQRALKESERQYRNILETMEEGYWEMDLDGVYTFANEAECRIHRLPRSEFIGRRARDFLTGKTARQIKGIFRRIYETGVPVSLYEVAMKRVDGSGFILESSASILKNANGEPIGFFGVSRDVTEKRKAEKELERYRAHLEQMVRDRTRELKKAQNDLIQKEKLSVLGQLTATVSHELRNPLGVITSSSFFLQRRIKTDDPKVAKHFKRIETQVALCDGIVGDLLEYTRGRNVMLKTVLLHPWLETLFQEMEETKSISIERRLPDNLPPVPHDSDKLRRVFINLIENAVHATTDRAEAEQGNKGEPYQPKIRVVAQQAAGKLVISVADNGAGMDKAVLEKAAEPLFTTRARGTGIGLAAVHKIIDDHGGDMAISSAPGRGTTVTVTLYCRAGTKTV